MATYEVEIPKSTWTLISIASCSFQCDCTMHVAESVNEPISMDVPNKEALRSKIYHFNRTDGQGLWGWASDGAIVTVDSAVKGISEEYQGLGDALNPGGGIDVNIQDQMTPTVILPMANQLGLTTVAIDTVLDSYSFTVTSSVGMSIGDHIRIINAAADRYYFGTILDITGNLIGLDSPIDYVYIATSEVTYSNINMAVDGSVTPVHFHLRTGSPSIPSAVDITRIIMVCQCNSAVDLNKFGDITGGLDRGMVFRQTNGEYRNVFNVKTNADLAALAYDWSPYISSNPAQGVDGFSWRLTFGGQSKIGVVIRVEQDGQLEMIVQDDLTSLESLFCILEGHVVD